MPSGLSDTSACGISLKSEWTNCYTDYLEFPQGFTILISNLKLMGHSVQPVSITKAGGPKRYDDSLNFALGLRRNIFRIDIPKIHTDYVDSFQSNNRA